MRLPSIWSYNELSTTPVKSFWTEMEDLFKRFGMTGSSLDIAAKAPAMDVSESNGSIKIAAELPGVDEKDISVKTEGNRLIISGEKKNYSKHDENDWHVEERSYGSFYRSMSLPFNPEEGAVKAHLDKGVLYLSVKKPAEVVKSAKTIPIESK
jgi:HSP20 family protein